MRAAYYGRSGAVRRLLELGADHTAVGTGSYMYEGKTALEVAEAEGKGEAAAVLREWAASHPDEEYDARVAAYDVVEKEKQRVLKEEENEQKLRDAAVQNMLAVDLTDVAHAAGVHRRLKTGRIDIDQVALVAINLGDIGHLLHRPM